MKRVRITKEAVEAIFEAATEQADYLIGIYKLVFPQWDDIVSIDGWPGCNDFTWKAIARMAMDWDQKHTDCLAGGAWMNSGFSGRDDFADLPNWTVSLDSVRLVLKAKEPALCATA